jgi:hypothetical protein
MSPLTFTACNNDLSNTDMSQDNSILYIQKCMFHIAVVIMQLKLHQLQLHAVKTVKYSTVIVKLSHNKS